MNAAVCTAINQPLEMLDLDIDDPHPGEVKVRLSASGVCHSDLSIQNGTVTMGPLPLVLGHEGAGVVTAVGHGVSDLVVGDHVVISWVPQCRQCFYCRRNEGHLCESGLAGMMTGGLPDGTTRLSRRGKPVFQMTCAGTFGEEAIIPAAGAVKVPSDIPLASAALLGCAVLTGVGAALRTAPVRPGDRVVVIGCGGVGMNIVQGARIAGAAEIIAVDTKPDKLALAKNFGATAAVDASGPDPAAAVRDLTEGRGVDIAFEAVGSKGTLAQAIAMARRGGQVVVVGAPSPDVSAEIPIFPELIFQAKKIKGCFYGSSNVHEDIPALCDLYQRGELKLDELVSCSIKLDQVNDALAAVEAGEILRTVITYQ